MESPGIESVLVAAAMCMGSAASYEPSKFNSVMIQGHLKLRWCKLQVANSRSHIMKAESVKFVGGQRYVSVSEIDIADTVEKAFTLAFQIFDQPLTCSQMAMSQFWDQAVDSSSNDGGVQHVSKPTFRAVFVKRFAISIESTEMPLSVQNISVQKHVAANSPDCRAPVKIGMPGTQRPENCLNLRMAIMIAQQINPGRIWIDGDSRLEPIGSCSNCCIQTALLTPANIENVTAQNDRFRRFNESSMLLPVPLTNRSLAEQVQIGNEKTVHVGSV